MQTMSVEDTRKNLGNLIMPGSEPVTIMKNGIPLAVLRPLDDEPMLDVSFRVPRPLVEDLPAFQAYMATWAERLHTEALQAS